MKKIKLKKRVSDIRLFLLAMMITIIGFTLSTVNLIETRNMNFDSQKMFLERGYQNEIVLAQVNKMVYDDELKDNSERIENYGIDFENVVSEIETGNVEEQITELKESEKEVNDKGMFK